MNDDQFNGLGSAGSQPLDDQAFNQLGSAPSAQAPVSSPSPPPSQAPSNNIPSFMSDDAFNSLEPPKPDWRQQVKSLTPKTVGVPQDGLDLTIKPNSLVGKAMRFMAIPLRAETASIMKAAEAVGAPGAKEWNQKHNPEGKWIPDAYISDISDFYIDRAAEAAGVPQIPGALGSIVRGSLATAKFGIGMAGNIIADPLLAFKVGTFSKEALEIQRVGGKVLNAEEVAKGQPAVIDKNALRTQGQARNLLTVQLPLTDFKADIEARAVQNIAAKMGTLPVVKQLGGILRSLSPDTGDPVLDLHGRTYDSLNRGDPVDLINRYAKPKDALKLTSDEDRVAMAISEATPNLTPDEIPDSMLKAAEKGRMQLSDSQAPMWQEESQLRRSLRLVVEDTAKKIGVELAPGREEAIVEASMLAKRAGAENLLDKYRAGVLHEGDIATKVRENYVHHAVNPSYIGIKDAAEYEARLAEDESRVSKAAGDRFMSSKDPTRQRKMLGTVAEKNEIMLEKTGLSNYFITDPVKAQVANLLKSKRLLRSSQYLDEIKDFGTRMTRYEASKNGFQAIDHPELEGKQVIIKEPDGSTTKVFHKDLYYPKDIAQKIQSRVHVPAVTGMAAVWRDYNRIHRSIIFTTSPGMRFGNTMDNVFKTAVITGKDFIPSSIDAVEVLLGKSKGFRSAPTALRPNGVFYDGATLKRLIDRYGLSQTGAFREGLESLLETGKEMTFKEALQRPGKLGPKYALERFEKMVEWANKFGEHGETSAKATLFLQRLKAGYEPEAAASEVTKWLFDYNRNSPVTEKFRFALPFFQHPAKTLLIAPELLGTAPGAYNFIQNGVPHVIANAFHDPVSQHALNQVLPPNIKQRDGIAGPYISEGTWMARIFGQPDAKRGSMAWFDPRIGLRILNHFDYFSKTKAENLIHQTSPVIQGLLGFVAGEGDFGKTLDYRNGTVNIANRASFALSKLIGGVSPFPNTEKMIMQAFGMVDPKHIEPYSVLVMKGLAGQFGGITDLDHDIQSRQLTLHYAFMDQKKQLGEVLRKEMGEQNLKAPTLMKYVGAKYGQIKGTTSADMYKQMMLSANEDQQFQAASEFLGGGMTAGDYVARMKSLAEGMKRLNFTYQVLGTRYLQMAAGSKNADEARRKVGMSPLQH